MTNIIPVILSGGSGTRLWPLSRKGFPKQFHKLFNDKTMLQNTLERIKSLNTQPPIIVTHEDYRFLVAEQLQSMGIKPGGIILEPYGRNTAPALGMAAKRIIDNYDDGIMLVLSADHKIDDVSKFCKYISYAYDHAKSSKLVTFGIKPTSAETGYGYIKSSNTGAPVSCIDKFVEKPDETTAKRYYESGEYLWNSGMFLFRADTYLSELKQYEPTVSKCVNMSHLNALVDCDFVRIQDTQFNECPNVSVDVAVMEATDNAVVVTMEDVGWSDVGTWDSLLNASAKEVNGNVIHGDVIAKDTKRSVVHSSGRLVTTLGLDGVIVVETSDAVMVANKDKVHCIKDLINTLSKNDRSELNHHTEVARPWGSYDSINSGDRFQVKRLTVNPGSKLSLQKHYHRSEHWVVVSGTAIVTIGDKEQVVTENQSAYIPVGIEHCLKNPGKLPLELIEVQIGQYLGEDDIVRISDDYGRV